MWWIIITIVGGFLLSCLERRFASYTMINGYMSKEQANDLFPQWKDEKNHKCKK